MPVLVEDATDAALLDPAAVTIDVPAATTCEAANDLPVVVAVPTPLDAPATDVVTLATPETVLVPDAVAWAVLRLKPTAATLPVEDDAAVAIPRGAPVALTMLVPDALAIEPASPELYPNPAPAPEAAA